MEEEAPYIVEDHADPEAAYWHCERCKTRLGTFDATGRLYVFVYNCHIEVRGKSIYVRCPDCKHENQYTITE